MKAISAARTRLRDPQAAATLAILLAACAYVASTLSAVRGHPGYSPAWDGVVEPAVWALIALLTVWRGWASPARAGWTLVGVGTMCEAVGQILWYRLVQSQHPLPFPSVADAAFLAFYPATYVGFALILRPGLARASLSVLLADWLDARSGDLRAA